MQTEGIIGFPSGFHLWGGGGVEGPCKKSVSGQLATVVMRQQPTKQKLSLFQKIKSVKILEGLFFFGGGHKTGLQETLKFLSNSFLSSTYHIHTVLSFAAIWS